jgi:iron complex outermembrane recepter protein
VSKFQNNSFRSWLLTGAAVALASGTAFAQSSDQSVETVVVTGSLIQRTAGDMPTPTVVLGSEAIAKTGMPNIGNVLAQLPQVQNTGDLTPLNSNFLTSGFGVWNVDLRGLGASRTLVLINGRRQVTGSPTGSAVDMNTVPTALIDHIDVITGGASAAYGSDAVAGVVNVVLKTDFEGIAANLQTGISSRGDGSNTYGTLTLGGNFANDRGNVTLSVTYDHSGAVMSKDRDITSTDTTWSPGLFQYTGTYLGGPVERYILGYRAAYSSYGVNGRFRFACPDATGNLVAAGYNASYFGCSNANVNPDGTTFRANTSGFDRNPNRYIQVPVSRKVIAANAHYDITNSLTAFVEATYALSHASQQLEPYPGTSDDGLSTPVTAGGTGILIPRTNPFIPAGIQTQLTATGSYPLNDAGGHIVTFDNSTSPGLYYYRRFNDLGDRTGVVNRDMAKVVFGLQGTIPWQDWAWSSYYEWGRTSESQFNGGYYDKIKMQEALTTKVATAGEIAAGAHYVTVGGINYDCANAYARAAGCVPINLFGAGSITPAAAAYVGSLVTIQDEATEQVANFQATGSLFELPGGKVKVALGAEYRRESADFIPDQASQSGTVAGNQQPATSGAFQVSELFAEGVVPVLKDLPFANYLEVDGAVRWAHYSTAGDAWSWNYRMLYKPIEDVTVRAAYSSATRAPNISELYTPPAQTFPGFGATTDPCRGSSPTANCQAHFTAVGLGGSAPFTYTQAQAQGVGGYQAGNANLKPETSHSLTVGVVYTPQWLSGFQATVDYYDIRIASYIGGLGMVATLQGCYSAGAAPYASNPYCQQITRQNIGGAPLVTRIDFPTFNLGRIKTNGIDTAFNYAFAMSDLADGLDDAGAWALALNLNYINSYQVDPGTPGASPQIYGGTVGTPHFRGNLKALYTLDPVTISTTMRYVGGSIIDRLTPSMQDLAANHLHSTWYLDLNVSYDLNNEVQLYVGANNVFDNRPPETFPGAGYDDTGTGTVADVYDPIGMYLYAGVNFKM